MRKYSKVEVTNSPTLTPINCLPSCYNFTNTITAQTTTLFIIIIFATHYNINMPKNNPLEGLPVNGVYPLSLSTAFRAAVTGKGGKEDVIGMKCTRSLFLCISTLYDTPDTKLMTDAFKPESITAYTEGRLDMNKGRASQLSFDTKVCFFPLSHQVKEVELMVRKEVKSSISEMNPLQRENA